MQTSAELAPWYTRWGIYLHEMFQPFSRLVFCLLTTLGLGWGVDVLMGDLTVTVNQDRFTQPAVLTLGSRFLIGTASLFLILLYYRLCDEFKDLETDRVHFPERPVPSGRVLLKDLRQMQWAATGLGFGLNLLMPLALLPFAALFLFAWLMGKWFFLPNLIGNNRLLAFLTHGPISLFGSFYVICLFKDPAFNLFGWPNLLLALWFALPGFAWEIARKTRAPEHEEAGYQIYSTMLGYQGAAALPPFFALANLGVGVWLAGALALPLWWIPVLTIVTLAYSLVFGLFLRRPIAWESRLKSASEAYTVLLLVGLPLALAQGRAIIWWPTSGF